MCIDSMIKQLNLWKALVRYNDGTTRYFFPTDKDMKFKSYAGFLDAKLLTNKDAYRLSILQSGSNVANLQVMPVMVSYDTKTKRITEIAENDIDTSGTDGEKSNVKQGLLFEKKVNVILKEMFADVKYNISMQGHSGEIWQLDFIVNDSLVLEVSTEKRSEIKVNTTFLKFIDIKQKYPNYKFALLLENSYKKVYGRHGMEKTERLNLLAPHRTFLAFGFAIIVLDNMKNLMPFIEDKSDSLRCSSLTNDELTKSSLF